MKAIIFLLFLSLIYSSFSFAQTASTLNYDQFYTPPLKSTFKVSNSGYDNYDFSKPPYSQGASIGSNINFPDIGVDPSSAGRSTDLRPRSAEEVALDRSLQEADRQTQQMKQDQENDYDYTPGPGLTVQCEACTENSMARILNDNCVSAENCQLQDVKKLAEETENKQMQINQRTKVKSKSSGGTAKPSKGTQ